MEQAILTGRTDSHIVELEPGGARVHRAMAEAFRALRDDGATRGYEVRIVSGFRDFATQLRIWNEKATGKRALLDDNGRPLAFATLSPEEIVFSILRWSALPGASRHHWGTDIDIVDGRALTAGYKVQLTPEEFAPGGPFAPMHDWLDTGLPKHGFFRPYAVDQGGVSPERWHVSYLPVAQAYYDTLDAALLESVVRSSEMQLKDTVLANLTTIFQRYVRNITPPGHGATV